MFKQSSVCNKKYSYEKQFSKYSKNVTHIRNIQPEVKNVHHIFQKVHRTLETSSPILNKFSMRI